MPDNRIAEHLADVRLHAAQLVAELGANASAAAPLLEAITALEQRLVEEHDDLHATLQRANARLVTFEQVLLQDPTGICILEGPEHLYTFTNPVYDQVVGRTDMVGKTLRALFPEIAGQGIYELLDQVYTTGVPFVTQDILIQFDRTGDGLLEDVYFDLNYRPLRAADGTIIGVVAFVVESTDRRALELERTRVIELLEQQQQTAEVERQRLLRILKQAPSAICTLDGPEHIFSFTNPGYDQLVGRTDLVGHSVREALPEMAEQGFFELLDKVYTTGTPFIGSEVTIQIDRQGTGVLEQAVLNFIYAPIRDTSEEITGIFVQAVDVTEVIVARQRAEAALALRDQFLSVAAHELKTPLTSLRGYTQLLHRRLRRADATDPRIDQVMNLIDAQSTRLTRLIDGLLDVTRINGGQLQLDRAPLDVGTLTAQVVEGVAMTAEQRTIHVTVPPDPCMIDADSLRLGQVLVNPLQNAVKYSPDGGDIDVTVACTPAEAVVRVRDSGLGIPQASLPKLFDRFYRVPETATRGIEGMGIGLSVVHEIVMLHGGYVQVASTEGVGSTFTVVLPRAQRHAGDDRGAPAVADRGAATSA